MIFDTIFRLTLHMENEMKPKKIITAILFTLVLFFPFLLPLVFQWSNSLYGKETNIVIHKIPLHTTGNNFYNLKNQPTLLFFGYASCPVICPKALSILFNIKQKNPQSEILFVTVDPEQDSRETLQKLEQQFPGLVALRGTPGQTRDLLSSLNGFSSNVGDKVTHSTHIYMITPQGKVIIYPYSSPDVVKITKDMKLF